MKIPSLPRAFAALALGVLLTGSFSIAALANSEPRAVPTFECVGLYWKPDGGSTDNACSLGYRKAGDAEWKEAMPLWFDPNDHAGATENSKEYRGSIVGLTPGTEYEVKLSLKSGASKTLKIKTWSNDFKAAKTVEVTSGMAASQPLAITEGGSAEKGYVVYTPAAGVVLDGKNTAKANIIVKAPFVILRGFTAKDSAENGIVLESVTDVVIEKCDISGWGAIAADGWGSNLDAAVYSKANGVARIVIQGNKFHSPRSNANSWEEERTAEKGARKSKHPIGPQGITMFAPANIVVRDNEIFSDPLHKYNDTMGEVHNTSLDGFPNRDSDVYNNKISNTYDDGIELEGANMNVRAWGNYFDDVYGAVGCASTSLGPIYIFRNVMNSSRKAPMNTKQGDRGAYFLKLGNENQQLTLGKINFFHNSMLQPPPRPGIDSPSSGGQAGIAKTGATKYQSNITSRNNIIFTREAENHAVNDPQKDPTNDFDYDLFNGQLIGASTIEAHGVKGKPSYDSSAKVPATLAEGSLGIDAGVKLPNFNDGFSGKAPDMGAVESSFTAPK